jgi:hypothetical protein
MKINGVIETVRTTVLISEISGVLGANNPFSITSLKK